MPDSRITNATWIPLGGVLAVAIVLCGGIYHVHNWMLQDAVWKSSVDAKFDQIEEKLEIAPTERWQLTDMQRWVLDLERANP